jgi:hypothetical protein
MKKKFFDVVSQDLNIFSLLYCCQKLAKSNTLLCSGQKLSDNFFIFLCILQRSSHVFAVVVHACSYRICKNCENKVIESRWIESANILNQQSGWMMIHPGIELIMKI